MVLHVFHILEISGANSDGANVEKLCFWVLGDGIFLSLYCDMAQSYFMLYIIIVREKFRSSQGKVRSSTSGNPERAA